MSGSSIRIVDMPDLGVVTDDSSLVGEHAGSGRFSLPALRTYVGRGIVNVLDHGAVGDGRDDTAPIQRVLDAYAGKAIVFIPDTGTPYRTTTLTLPSSTDLLLHGTLLAQPGMTNAVVLIDHDSNITIRGHGVIDGNKPGQVADFSLPLAGIAASVATNLRVSGITIQNAGTWNINITVSSNVVFHGVTLIGGASANEFAAGCDDCWLVNCTIDGTGNGDYGFAFYGGVTNSGAIGNHVKNCGAGTIYSPPGIGILSDTTASYTEPPCYNIVIADNIIHDCAAGGISCINPTGGFQRRIVIADNICYNNGRSPTNPGIADCYLDNTTDATITGNQFSSSGAVSTSVTGIFIGPSCASVSIIGNHILNVGEGRADASGIWIVGVPHVYVGGNHIYDNQTVPTMSHAWVGGVGANSALIGNFTDLPSSNLGMSADTVGANATPGGWTVGGDTTGGDMTSSISAGGNFRALLQYKTGTAPRWLVGTDGTSANNYIITRVPDAGAPTTALSIERGTGIVQIPGLDLFLGDGIQTTSDVVFIVQGAAQHNKVIRLTGPSLSGRFEIVVIPDSQGGDFQLIATDNSGVNFAALTVNRLTRLLTIAVPPSFTNDAAAATGGTPVGGVYRNGSQLMIRTA